MKKLLALLLSFALLVSFTACESNEAEKTGDESNTPDASTEESADEPVELERKEAKGVTIPEFSVTINDKTITNVELGDLALYEITAQSVNSAGTASSTTYIGFAMADILAQAGIECATSLKAIADDGYEIEYTYEMANSDFTLLAVSKNGEQFKTAPWFAPCSSTVTGDFLKNVVSISIDGGATAEGDDGASEEADIVLEADKSDKTDKVTFEPFSFKVNGNEVTNDTLKDASIFKVEKSAQNKNEEWSTSTYTGFVLADVLEACGVAEYTTVKVVCNDGYEKELDAEIVSNEFSIIAIEKDKELGEDGTIWFAPCSSDSSKDYMKLVVEIVAE